MNHIGTRQIFIIYIFIALLILFNELIPERFVFSDLNSVIIPVERFSDGENDMNYRMKDEDDPTIMTFSARVYAEELDALEGDDLGLSLTKIEAQGYIVRWNDQCIGYAGDPADGNANLWNSSFVFVIPADHIQPINTLSIEAYSDYEIGAYSHSIMISSLHDAERVVSNQMAYSHGLSLIGFGVAIFSFIITFGLSTIRTKNRKILIMMTVSILLMVVYAMSYMTINHLPISFLNYKKAVLIAAFLAMAAFGLMCTWLIKSKVPVISSLIALAVFLIGTALCKDMLTFKRFYLFGLGLVPLNVAVLIFVMIPKLKTSDEARFLLGGLLVIFVNALWETIALIVHPSLLTKNSFSTILVLAAINMFVIVLDSVKTTTLLHEKISFSNSLLNQSKMDELSGLYNKSHCMELLSELEPPFSVAMMDIDDFKVINDGFGHIIGDLAIRHVADIIKNEFREGDVIARYGGDEYVAAVRCQTATALHVFERVRQGVSAYPLVKDKKKVNITMSIGVYHVKKRRHRKK